MLVYLIYCNVSNKYYVGQTKRPLMERWYFHIRESFNIKHASYRSHFHSAIRKYGPEVFELQVLVDDINQSDYLNECEKLWIRVLQADNPMLGYNLGIGGEGVTLTSEVREKMRMAKLGKPHSPEHIAKRAATRIGRPLSDQHKAKLSQIFTGRVVTAETRAKISKKLLGHKNCVGIKHTEEARRNMSLAHKGQIPWNKGTKKISPLSSPLVAIPKDSI